MYKKYIKILERKVMYHSMQERKKREHLAFEREYLRLKELKCIELKAEYINTKTKYEQKKNIQFMFNIGIVFSIILGVWKEFYHVLNKLIDFIVLSKNIDMQVVKLGTAFAFTIIGCITIAIIFAFSINTKEIFKIYRNLLIIEDVTNSRDID